MSANDELNLRQAFDAWSRILGLDAAFDAVYAQEKYGQNTLGTKRALMGALTPSDHFQVIECVKVADQYEIPIYTLSTGKNWGYGSSLPVVENCVILDLSRMNRILHFDPQLGHVILEPGVTQQQLHEFLRMHNFAFMVPTTGAGPTVSVLGNALEKGFGITPHEDHFGAVLQVKAILPDGSIYHSALHDMGGYRVDPIFKWKLGPYFEGLFVQGNFGIVTQASIALARTSLNLLPLLTMSTSKTQSRRFEILNRN